MNQKRNHFNYQLKVSPFHSYEWAVDGNGRRRGRDGCSIDIIIPYHMSYALVRKALLSILHNVKSNPYQVTLVDDGSPGDAASQFVETISQAPQTQCLRLDKQSGFGAAVNYAISKTQQNYVCVMHSDCELKHLNCLQSMGEALLQHKKDNIRLVVPLSNNPTDNDIPELNFSLQEFNSGSDIDGPMVTVPDSPLPMYCFMCHRGLFERIGGLKPYPFTWFENVEFFHRMKQHGFKQAIVKDAWIQHKGSGTAKPLWISNPDSRDIMLEGNRERCIRDIRSMKEM